MKVKDIIAAFVSKEEAKADKAIKAIKADGNSTTIIPMIHYLASTKNNDHTKEIIEILSSLKDTSAVDEIMQALRDEELLNIRQPLLSTIWNTQLDYTPYFADFVAIACEGDFLEALDCLTIIENMPSQIEERHLLEAQWHLKEYHEDQEPKEERKQQIISEIAQFILDTERAIEG